MSLISPPDEALRRAIWRAVMLVALATLIRVWFLGQSGLELYGDEAQYAIWARTPALGYFTKPPLIAWVIAATTWLFGPGEAAVRLAAPLFQAGTALLVGLSAQRLYGGLAGALAAGLWILLPGVSFASVVISTDTPLLFFGALALLGYIGLWRNPHAFWPLVLLGVGLGLGFLSKLAMAYGLLAIALHMALDQDARRLLKSPHFWLALGLGFAIDLPNIAWNIAHSGATYGHVADNAGLSRALLHPDKLAEFLLSQAAIFGPIPCALLIWVVAKRASWLDPSTRLALAFALPPLAIIALQALATRAFGNWAAFAYLGGTLVAAQVLNRRPLLTRATFALHGLVAVMLYAWGLGAIHPPLAHDPVAALHGWRNLAQEIGAQWRASGAPNLIATERMDMALLLYYLPDPPGEIRVVSSDGRARHEFDVSAPLQVGADGLLVARFRDIDATLSSRFNALDHVATISVPRPGARPLKYYLFNARGYRGVEDKQADNPSR